MIAERRAGLFSAVLFLSPLRPCQRRTWIGARFSKKTSPAEGGEGRQAPNCPHGTALRPHRHSPAPPRCGTRGDLLIGNQALGRAPSLLPPGAGGRSWRGRKGAEKASLPQTSVPRLSAKMCQFKYHSEAVPLKYSRRGGLAARGDLSKCLAFWGEQHGIA